MKNFPSFPQFRKVKLEDKKHFSSFTKAYPPYSDYNFTSFWSYDVEEDSLVSNLNGNMVIRLRDYITSDYIYSFFGNKKPLETIQELIGFMEGINMKPVLKMIPKTNFENKINLISENYRLTDDRDNYDYIFSLEDINKLPGKVYSNKRNKVARFQKDYPDAVVKEIDLTNRDNDKHILFVFSHWGKDRATEDTEHELKALKRLLKYASHLELIGIGIYINNKLEAFTIVESLHEKFSIAHYTKADPKKIGIFEFLYKSMAGILLKKGCLFFNREQDLGIPGLRNAKMSWKPIYFLEKYTITKKSAKQVDS